MKQYISVLDLESGGLKPKENPITQMAFQIIDGNHNVVKSYNKYVKPYGGLELSDKALEVTGLSVDLLEKEGIPIEQAVLEVCEIHKEYTLGKGGRYKPVICGHNIPFDIGFLRETFNIFDISLHNYFDGNEYQLQQIDTMAIARSVWQGNIKKGENERFTLEACCERAGIRLVKAHDALADVDACRKLLKWFSNPGDNNGKQENERGRRKYFRFSYHGE